MKKIVLDAGYRGYVGIEYEGPDLSEMDGIAATKKLLEKSNKGVIYKDLKACAEYDSGLKSAAQVSATTLLILGKKDFLTPPFKAKDLIKSFKDPVVKEIKDSGHTLMAESPNKVLDYLIEIL